MFSGSDEPFVLYPLYMLLSCVFLIFLWEDCSLGYQCWPLIVGIWAQDGNIALLFFHSCRSSGNTTGRVSGRQQLQMIPLTWVGWFCPAAPFLSRHCSRWSLVAAGHCPGREMLTGGEGWGLFLCPPARESAQATFSCSSHRYFLLATAAAEPQEAQRAQAASCWQEGEPLQPQLMPASCKQRLLIFLAFYIKDIVAFALEELE